MTTEELYSQYVIPCYRRDNIVLVKGKGSWVWDKNGKKYLDLFPGWGVNGLGHCHKRIVKAIKKQADILIHVPNNYYNQPQAELAKLLVENSFPAKCFFSNSGAEANECAIKLARKLGNQTKRTEIITALGSFHGRTIATITATGQEKYKHGFEPLLPGFNHIPFNDLTALKNAVTDKTIAIILEPIQGEGGIKIAAKEYIQEARKLCDEKEILLILDEIQTGIGRTGNMFAYQHYGIEPDIITLAKTLGGGTAIGATIVKDKYTNILTPGTHASTFGGNPLACSAAVAVIETIKKYRLIERTRNLEIYLRELLTIIARTFPRTIKEIRGMGLMWGIELTIPGGEIIKACIEKGLLINCTQETVLRFLPALTVTKQELALGTKILTEALRKYAG